MSLRIDLENITTGRPGTNFETMLLLLILKADAQNRERLHWGFPEAVEMIEAWWATPTGEAKDIPAGKWDKLP